MLYEKALLDKWTEYAVRKTAREKIRIAEEQIKAAEEKVKATEEKARTAEKKGVEKGIEKGIEKGAEQKSYEVVENLIVKFGFDDEQAAAAAGIPVAVVKKMRTALKKKK